jgi:alpha-tubulin suppressor-like RCC1 family protein
VKCWGNNQGGQLGLGTSGDAPNPRPVDVPGLGSGVLQVSTGGFQTCVLLDSGVVQCFGGAGLIGDGTSMGRASPTDVVGITTAVEVDAAGNQNCARLASGVIQCWGHNGRGQLGDGTTTDRLAPVTVMGTPFP